MNKKGHKAAIVPRSLWWLTTAKYCGSKFGNELTSDHVTLPHRTNIGEGQLTTRQQSTTDGLRPRFARPWQWGGCHRGIGARKSALGFLFPSFWGGPARPWCFPWRVPRPLLLVAVPSSLRSAAPGRSAPLGRCGGWRGPFGSALPPPRFRAARRRWLGGVSLGVLSRLGLTRPSRSCAPCWGGSRQ